MKNGLAGIVLGLLIVLSGAGDANAFMQGGCGSGECRDCHKLTGEEASKILSGWVDKVRDVREAPVKGLWAIDVEKGGQKGRVFLDYSKKFLMSAQIVRIETKEDVTNERTVDYGSIPLADALVLGKPTAAKKVIVYSDPDCHFCSLLHGAMKEVVRKDPDVAFHIKLYSRNRNTQTMRKAEAVLCSKSLDMLDEAYEGKVLPPPSCRTDAAERFASEAASLGIHGTPAMVLPGGKLVTGYRDADSLLRLINPPAPPAEKAPADKPAAGAPPAK